MLAFARHSVTQKLIYLQHYQKQHPIATMEISPVNIGLTDVFPVPMTFHVNNFFERAMVSYIMVN